MLQFALIFCAALSASLSFALPARAEEPGPVPEGGEAVLTTDLPTRADRPFDGTMNVIDVEGQPFDKATEIDLNSVDGAAWQVALHLPSTKPIQRGDVLLAEFYVKGKGKLGAECVFTFVFEDTGPEYAKSSTFPGTADDTAWRRFVVPFRARRDFAPGEGQVAFHLAHTPQRIAVGGASVTNYGDAIDIGELPSIKRTYPGMEADAPWRAEAAQRIDELRKGDLTIQVVDTDGNPLPGATVEVEMTRHAFNFGTAIAKPMVLGENEDAEKYRQVLLENFNYATGENFMKPPAWEAEGGREEGLRTIAWLNDHDLKVRGHNLIWPSFGQDYFFPDYISEGFRDRLTVDETHAKEWMRGQIRDHIARKAMDTRGKVVGWDVANEVSNLRDVMDGVLGGDDELAYWFKLLKDIDPDAEAYLNDYGIVTGGGANTSLRQRYKQQAQFLIDESAGLDAIGLQGHFSTPTPADKVWEVFDDLAELGLPLEITEFDIISSDDELNGQYTRDFLTMCFAHESMQSFIVWGFWEGRHWRPESAFYDLEWNLKPTGQAWQDLVLDEWWTRETVTTDASGNAVVRGFQGDYVVRVGETKIVTALPKDGRTVRVEAR